MTNNNTAAFYVSVLGFDREVNVPGVARDVKHLACVTGRRKGGKGSKRLRDAFRALVFFPFPSPSTPTTQAIKHLNALSRGSAYIKIKLE